MSWIFQSDIPLDEAQQSLLWDYGCQGLEFVEPATDGACIRAYFAAPVTLPSAIDALGSWQEQDEVDWMARYYAELQPIYLDKLIVSPSHHQLAPQAGKHIIALDPGMAFGSGHHETTHLALKALESQNLKGKRVLDVGTGSGILAIAAALLGAEAVDAIDNDPLTIPVAQENIAKNAARHPITLRCATLDAAVPSAHYQLIVANLFAELHVTLMPEYQRVLVPEGRLIITGILAERLETVQESLAPSFHIDSVQQEGEWCLIRAHKQPEGA